MKKWLGEASSLCGHNNKNLVDESSESFKDAAGSASLNNEKERNHCVDSTTNPSMGLGVSSESLPPTNLLAQPSDTHEASTSHRCSGEVSFCHSSVAFITSVSSRIQVSSPCHHYPAPTVSVQLHHPTSTCSSSSHKEHPHLMTLRSPSTFSSEPSSSQASCSSNQTSHHCVYENNFNVHGTTTSSQPTNNTQGLAMSLPTSYPASGGNVCHTLHTHCSNDGITSSTISHSQLPPSSNENLLVESSSECESQSESVTGNWCGVSTGANGQHRASSGCEYDTTPGVSATKNFHNPGPSHRSTTVAHNNSGAGTSSGCGHWCSACRVRVQVEVECVPGSQRSPSGSRRGVRTLSFPKRVRHKVKAPTKDLNGSLKKKKSPWPFRLNCRLRANKSENDQETGLSALNVGCASCVCPGYRRPEAEPMYRSVIQNSSSNNNLQQHNPVVELSRFNPEAFPISDLEENARQERAREMAEGVEPPPGFTPILRENQGSLALPLTYNSMLDLQVLLESSLRLGFGGPRTSGFSYPGELIQQMGSLSSGPLMSRTVHTQVDYIHCLVPDLLAITNCGFYWGKMDRYEAERHLENRPEGTFLLRDSAQEEYLFSVSFRRYGRSLHARIEQWNHNFSFDSHDPGVFASPTVCGLIEHYKDPSCCMFFEPLLTNPLARTFPFPLQHLCRATIGSKATYDGINQLELPKSLKNYLKEYHYKQRVRVRHLD